MGVRRAVGGSARGARAAGRRPGQGSGQQHRVLAARRRRVDAGVGDHRAVPLQRRGPGDRRLRETRRPDRDRPGRDCPACQAVRRHRRRRPRRGRAHPVGRAAGSAGRAGVRAGRCGQRRLGEAARSRGRDADDRRRRCRRDVRTRHRPGWHGGRPGGSVRRHRQHAAVRRGDRGDRDPAVHLPEPHVVDTPGDLRGSRVDGGPGRDLPAGQACRPDRQRAERGHPHRAGVRRRHRLRTAAGRPVPGGATPAFTTGTRRWRSHYTAPDRRSGPAPPP